MIKSYADDHYNTTGMERGLTEELIVHRLHALQHTSVTDGLSTPRVASKAMANTIRLHFGDINDIHTSVNACFNRIRFHKGDIALARLAGEKVAGDILFFFRSPVTGDAVCITPWQFVAEGSSHDFMRFKIQTDIFYCRLSDLMSPVLCRKGSKFALVYVPLQFRD